MPERRTVLVALAANAAIAVVKGIAGFLTGSAAMLAEAAHSVADTANQVFLLVSLSLGEKPPDEEHPFGHGKERFLWSFLAAVLIFVAGAVFSVGDGVMRLVRPTKEGSFAIAYGTLAFALVAEGAALARAVRTTREAAREAKKPFLEFVRVSKEPTAKTVIGEDTVAVVGVLIAAGGIGMHQLTGAQAWDAGAAIVVGVLLVGVATLLGRNFRGLLLGKAARPDQRKRLRDTMLGYDEVDAVVDLRTMYVGPHDLLVAARIDLADGLDSGRVEELSNEIDRSLRDAVPDVKEVFLDATPKESR